MADPLSIAASITGVLAFGVGLSQFLVTCFDKLQSAQCNIKDIHAEVEVLCQILGHLDRLIASSENPSYHEMLYTDLSTVLQSCKRIFLELEKHVRRFGTTPRDSKLAQKWTSFRWTLKENMISKLRVQLENHKATLKLTLMILGHFQTNRIESAVEEIRGHFQNMTVADSQNKIESELLNTRRMLHADGANATDGVPADRNDAASRYILERYLDNLESIYASSDTVSERFRPESSFSSQPSMALSSMRYSSDYHSDCQSMRPCTPEPPSVPQAEFVPYRSAEFWTTVSLLDAFARTKDAKDLDELPKLRASIQDEVWKYMSSQWTNRAVYLVHNRRSSILQENESVKSRLLGLSLSLADQVYAGAVWGIGGFARDCRGKMEAIVRNFVANDLLRDDFLCGVLKSDDLSSMTPADMAVYTPSARRSVRRSAIRIPIQSALEDEDSLDPTQCAEAGPTSEFALKDAAVKRLGVALLERAHYLVSRSVLLNLRAGESIEEAIAERSRGIQCRVWPDNYESRTTMAEWNDRLQATVQGVQENPTLQDGILCGRLGIDQLAQLTPEEMGRWGRVEAPHPGRLVTPVNGALHRVSLGRKPSDWDLGDEIAVYPPTPKPSKVVPVDIYPALAEPPAGRKPSDGSVSSFERDHRRSSSIFIGQACALCEEPLEYRLFGERALQFPCRHVAHAVCINEEFRETTAENRDCPQCSAPLGDVGLLDPGQRDSGYVDDFDDGRKLPDLRSPQSWRISLGWSAPPSARR